MIEGRNATAKRVITPDEFTVALKGAVDHVYGSLEKPVEGTIITVMRATAEEAGSGKHGDFTELLDRILGRAKDALARTPDLLPVLRKAGVVDAGAKGFVHILEGIVSHMHGDPFVALFSESTGRALVSVPRTEEVRFTDMCTARRLPAMRIGVVDVLDPRLVVQDQFEIALRELNAAWSATLRARFE